MELVGQILDAVTVPGEARLKIIALSREDGLDDVGADRFFAAAQAVLEGQGEVLLGLQRSAQPFGEQTDCRVVGDGGDPGVGVARPDEPCNVGRTVLNGAVEGGLDGTITDSSMVGRRRSLRSLGCSARIMASVPPPSATTSMSPLSPTSVLECTSRASSTISTTACDVG
jgi:hypothetical protein